MKQTRFKIGEFVHTPNGYGIVERLTNAYDRNNKKYRAVVVRYKDTSTSCFCIYNITNKIAVYCANKEDFAFIFRLLNYEYRDNGDYFKEACYLS